MSGSPVAAEVGQRRDSHRRWLRLGPTDDGVLLIEVEVPVGVDPVEWAKREEDYVLVSSERFASLEDALTALTERGVNTDAFDAVWKNENPF